MSDPWSGAPLVFWMLEPSTITWNWKTQYWLTTNANPSSGGTVTPSSGWQEAGAFVSIQALPNPGYTFQSWTGSGSGSYSGSLNPVTIQMNHWFTETANFKAIVKPLTVTLISPSNEAVLERCPVKLKAKVTWMGSPISGATVKFYVDGNLVSTQTTNEWGIAQATFPTATQSCPMLKGIHAWYAVAEKPGVYPSGTSVTWTFRFL